MTRNRNALFDIDTFVDELRYQTTEMYNYGKQSCIDPKTYDFFVDAQFSSLTKKFPRASRSNELRTNAFNTFKSVNTRIGLVNHLFHWPDSVNIRNSKESRINRILARAREYTWAILSEDIDTNEFFSFCKHSSGTSLGLKYRETHLTAKSELPLTSTERARSIHQMYLRWDTDLANAYQYRYPSISILDPKDTSLVYKIVTHSRMTTVPKNDLTDRTIAVEPTANMFLQQGLGRLIAEKLKVVGIDIESQQFVHVDRAFTSSITLKDATIDFSSASDCVGIQLLRYLLPPKWFYVVDAIRCSHIDIDGESVELSCISTMGNACTFPLETLVFYVLAQSSLIETESKYSSSIDFTDRRVTVFGDDCILPTYAASLFCEVAELVGFSVNYEKSFITNFPFRESCGGDYFHGRNVRGLYIKPPRSTKKSVLKAWLYTIFNMYLKKQISCFGTLKYVYYDQVFRLILCKLRTISKDIEIVPDYLPDDSGLKVVLDFSRFKSLLNGFKYQVSRDHHGTIYYNRLMSVDLDACEKDCNFHYWNNRKTAYYSSITAHNKFLKKESLFESLKKEGGYVIRSGRDFWSDEWSGVTHGCTKRSKT